MSSDFTSSDVTGPSDAGDEFEIGEPTSHSEPIIFAEPPQDFLASRPEADQQPSDDVDAILRRLVAGEIDQEHARQLIENSKQAPATGGTGTNWEQPTASRAEAAEQVRATQSTGDPTAQPQPNLLGQLGDIASDFGSIASKSLRNLLRPRDAASNDLRQHSQAAQPGVERLRIRAVGCRVEIQGDPSVATVAADGPHRLRHSGDALEVIAEAPSRSMLNAINPLAARGEQWRLLGPSLVLRVNPAIIVDAEVTGGGLISRGVAKFGTVRVHVAGLQLKDVKQIQDGSINAGNGIISGAMSEGRSRLSVSGGNLSVRLISTANVTIRSLNSLGHVSWPDPELQGLNEYVVGNGAGRLDIDVVVGRAKITVLPPGAA